ncbi:MAG: hypothetical protein L3J49_04620 [Desulfobulbaceae bacterium]|nr:hypothetical protein [Desulfobulbaceae bacterium]
MSKTMYGSSSPRFRVFTAARMIILVLAVLFFNFPVLAATTPEKSTPVEPVITAEVNPVARLTIYKTVAVLPALVDGNSIDEQLSTTLYQALLELQKYSLLPLEISRAWFEQNVAPGTPFSPQQIGHQAGIDLQASAVLVAEVQYRRQIGEILAGINSRSMATWIFTLIDTANRKTVWRLTVLQQNGNQQQPASGDQAETTLQQAFKVLRTEMVKKGDIFSTQLPHPEVLSTQGDIRSVRIVLQPDPPHIFSAYQLLRAESADAAFTPAGPPVANKAPLILVDTGLEDATAYFYTVIGLTGTGFANVPAPPFKVNTTGPPPPVKGLHAAGGSLRHIQLYWEPSQDPTVNGYVILRSQSPGGPFEQIAVINGREKQTYIDKGQPNGYSRYGELEDNSSYFYTIRTRNVVGVESSDSRVILATTMGPPQPPTSLQAIDRQPRKIPLAWTAAPNPEVVGYAIYRASQADGPFLQIDYVSGRERQQYVDDGSWDLPLASDTTYWYRLRSVNVVDVQSPDSSTVSATTKAAPAPVTGVQATSGLFRRIELNWQPNPEPDIRAYEIYRGSVESNINTRVSAIEPELTTYTDTSLGDSRTYWYQIRAIDQDDLPGQRSEIVQATTKQPPTRPTRLRTTINGTEILISWRTNPEQDIAHYEISSGGFLTGLLGTPEEPRFLYRHKEDPGTELRFQVRAVDSDGLKSEYSEPITVLIPK